MIVHDELDLPLGIVRVKAGGGLAGHNGLRSIKAHLHSDAFTRVRIGIGKPPGGKERGADHVLTARPGATAPSWRSASRWPPMPSNASWPRAWQPPRTGSMDEVPPDRSLMAATKAAATPTVAPPSGPSSAAPTDGTDLPAGPAGVLAPLLPLLRSDRPSPACTACGPGWWPSPSRPEPSPWPGWPRPRGGGRLWWRCRPTSKPNGWLTIWPPSSAPTRSRCARRGRPCRSSGSAPASRPWAGACGPCGGWVAGEGARRIASPGFWWLRCDHSCNDSAPTSRTPPRWSSARASRSMPRRWWPSWSAWGTGGSIRSSTGASWRCGGRSSTCSARPPTCRSASTCGATRWTGSASSRWATSDRPRTWPRSRCSAAASCCPRPRFGSAPAGWSARRPGGASSGSACAKDWSSTAWSPGCRG